MKASPHCLARVALGLLAFGAPRLFAADAPAAPSREGVEFFEKRIRPLLAEKCYECHSAQAKKVKGGLLLDTRAGVLKGGDSGPVIVPGQPEKSLLIRAVRYEDEDLQMPPKHRLDPPQVADLVAWVKMGAPDPRTESPAAPAARPNADMAAARQFWSFQPVKDPPPPAVRNPAWVRNDVDRFILARLEAKGLAPAAAADKRTLLRRVTFGLTGLPPTPEEIDAFLADTSPKAFATVVERLLASPHYGEHWGRHWLDVARYADTSGCNSDFPISTAYKYRNYVIAAFNADKPYDQFLREQIAGDLLPARSDAERFEKIIATGYLATARRFGSRASEFHQTLEDVIDNLGKTALGLSLGCARCHDHKYDPVPTTDYYALYGIFHSTRFAFPGTEIYRHPKDFVPLATGTNAQALYDYYDELAELDDRLEKLQEEKRKFERLEKLAKKEKDADNDGALQVERKDKVKLPKFESLLEVKAALEDARSRLQLLERRPPDVERAYAVSEGRPANARVQRKGDPRNEGDEVPRGFLQILGGQQLPPETRGSGRLELARWLTDPKNPLTARVMVNRIWQHHFGRGIVGTPNDFGARGDAPTHPELLDWLAARFVESGWSVKAMHRLVLLSATYQQAAAGVTADSAGGRSGGGRSAAHAGSSPSTDGADSPATASPTADYRGFPRRRLSAEEIRDAMLAISGALDRTMGGPHPFPPEHEWRYTQHRPFVAVYESNRRSVYLMQQRIKKHPYLEIFDGADPNVTTAARPVSHTPLQALFLMNAPFAHEQADRLAVRVGLAFRDDRERIDYAYQLVFGRHATKEEVRLGQDYLRDCLRELTTSGLPADQQPRAALASYARVLFSSNEFLFVD